MREAEAALARAKEEAAASTNECDASARAHADLDKAIDDASCAVLGGRPAVEKKESYPTSPAGETVNSSFESFQRVFPLGARRPKGFCGVLRWDAFRRWHSQSTI